ncbi:MAG TPA: histidine kinase [Sphaerochaeta sp.]|nr:histidine kinase [Sphaerochaeta sp.]
MRILEAIKPLQKTGTLRSWLLSYNIVMLCIILALVIILFGAVFSLLGEMQSRNNTYQALNTLAKQLVESRELYKSYGEIPKEKSHEEVLKDFRILDWDIQISLQRLKVEYDENPTLHFLHVGITNGLQFIKESIETMEKIEPANQSQEYFNIFYTGDKVYNYLQDYTFNRYLSYTIVTDASWMKDAQTRIKNYRRFAILLFIIIAISYMIVVYKMTMRLVRPVNKMVETAEQISSGNFEGEDIPLEGPEELIYLEKNLNQMRQSLRERLEMIAENTKLEKMVHSQELEQMRTTRELEKARYKALQSQINPHFLFNTLNIISRTALFEEANNTVDLIDNLASIFRYTLEYHDDVSIEEELRFVREYLTIQQFRFADRIEFSIHCPEEFYEVRIPPLIIQPFVENAMIHGLEPKVEGGRIEILLSKEGRRLIIQITDTGVGIDISKLNQIQFDGKQHIGVKNISDRLKHYYKGKANLALSRISEEGGTKVTLSLPIKSGGKKSVQTTHS